MNTFLTYLTLEKKEWFVVVKILSIWNHPPKHPNDQTTMILVDDKGTRIDVVVPPDSYKKNFPRNLKEEKWYFLWDFDVIPPSLRERNSNHPYQLSFNKKTIMAYYKKKFTSEFLQCLDFLRINNPSEEDKQFVVDVVGVVRSVSPIGRLLEGESDLDSSYVTFTLKDLA
ncbi:uncharacterized protein LOC110228048 [Arabidopsis lyrata subsp. lyrata]|uniref:uncharacterized protein LOC110228048 n=1 Tax=Arabidopsis lyrata subsp. lyrata TaxID=81972 RepID=UPI000A29E7F1|nr:uncharacterized protein LOC110228048 [Arabidopsis lyrata subsp. lyrata]|eukprot:XP_020879786.1 uncharacterized protein LOC110228048 [Arabidopsis lyrata subsp. lyrata]